MHEQWRDLLPLYVNGTLDGESREALEIHLVQCAECRGEVEAWSTLAEGMITEIEALQATLPPLALPDTNRFAPYPLNPPPIRQRHSWEDNIMFSSHAMSLPAQPRRMEMPLTLVATLVFVLLAASMIFFTTSPDLSVILSPNQSQPVDIFERYINEAWNAGNLDVLDELLTSDHACYEPGLMEGVFGVEHMSEMIANYRTAFPDWQFTVEDIAANDDEVWARLVGTGTHNGPFVYTDGVTLEATAKPVSIEMMVNAHLADGRITEQRFQFDLMSLFEQLGGVNAFSAYLTQLRTLEQAAGRLEGWNQHDTNAILEAMHSPGGFTYAWGIDNDGAGVAYAPSTESTMTEGLPGKLFNSFPDLELTPVNVMASGRTLILEVRARGTFENDLFDLRGNRMVVPATHQTETWSWLFILQFDSEGKIILNRQYWDGFPESMPSQAVHEARNMELGEQFFDAFNQHDIEAMAAYYPANGIFRTAFGYDRYLKTASTAEFSDIFEQMLWYAFPDLQATITNMEAVGDTVIVETTMTGTFENDLQGWYTSETYPATHRVEAWSWLTVSRYDEDGKIIESRIYWDGFPQAETPQAIQEAQNMGLTRQWVNALNQHDMDAILEYAAGSMVGHPYANRMDTPFYPSYIENWMNAFFQSFPDAHFTVVRTASAGDVTFTELSVTGTFERDFSSTYSGDVNSVASQKEETWTWLFVNRWEAGKVVEEWWYVDWPWETRYDR